MPTKEWGEKALPIQMIKTLLSRGHIQYGLKIELNHGVTLSDLGSVVGKNIFQCDWKIVQLSLNSM